MMKSKLSKQLKGVVINVAIIHFLTLATLIGLSVFSNHILKVNLAEEQVRFTRGRILAGDLRQAYVSLTESVGPFFKAVTFANSQSNNAFAVPDPKTARQLSSDSFSNKLFYGKVSFDIAFSKEEGAEIGKLYFVYSRWDFFWYALGAWLLLTALSVPFVVIARRRVSERHKAELHAEKNEAIATTVQMLAHDIVKPFSILKGTIDSLRGAKTTEDFHELSKSLLPETEWMLFRSQRMATELMLVGGELTLIKEEATAESLIHLSLSEVFRAEKFRSADIHIQYRFYHQHRINIDTIHMSRVLINILSNAVEATNGKCEFHISTRDLRTKAGTFVEFLLRNTNSFIPQINLATIFDTFVSKGKRNGHGLGLAIAKKMVEAHGGEIACSSLQNPQSVVFTFTVPAGAVYFPDKVTLPVRSSDYAATPVKFERGLNENISKLSLAEKNSSKDVRGESILASLNQPVKVLVVDDEAIYRNIMSSKISTTEELIGRTHVFFASNGKDAFEIVKREMPQLIICDVDLGSGSLDGFSLVKAIRKTGAETRICMHSNRCLAHDYTEAINAGADSFLPKPMSRAHLVQLVEAAATILSVQEHALVTEEQKPEISVIDDEKIFCMLWENQVQDARVNSFTSPDEFWAHVKSDPTFLERQTAIVTDLLFENCTGISGSEFAAELKERTKTPIFLSSNAPSI